MKARTYARLALLIPLLLWVILLFVELLINVVVPFDTRLDEPTTFFGYLEIYILIYVMGILVWFLPYLVLSIVLLLVSFRSRLETLQYLFILSPFAMAILVMVEATVTVSLYTVASALALQSTDLESTLITAIVTNLMLGILALVCGYICVALGIGGYKLLQWLGKIREEKKTNPEIIMVSSLEA